MQSMLRWECVCAAKLNIIITIQQYNSMEDVDLKCCLCTQTFLVGSQPRMMPYCEHSACTNCLKKFISDKNTTIVKCLHCGHQENMQETDLQYFPKNISLAKIIKELSLSNNQQKHPATPLTPLAPLAPLAPLDPLAPLTSLSPRNSQPIVKNEVPQASQQVARRSQGGMKGTETVLKEGAGIQPDKNLRGSEGASKGSQVSSSIQGKQMCRVHNKELQIICITDRQKLCPHCALFGKHKDHLFKTLTEVESEMEQRRNTFEDFRRRKQAINQRITSKQFKDGLIHKIGAEKERLVGEIKRKFVNLHDNIRMAEKQAFDDVVKHFKAIYQKIVALLKEENDSQLRYRQWQQRCVQLFTQASKLKSIQEKSSLYFGGPLEVCKEGENHIRKIQSKVEVNLFTIQRLITSIKVMENVSVANSIFNYINVVVETEDLQLITQAAQQVIEPRQLKEENHRIKVQFSPADPFAPIKLSNIRKSQTPRKKSSSKEKNQLNRTADRKSQVKSPTHSERTTVERMIEEFCERQNLDTLDLTGYGLNDGEIMDVLRYLKPIKRIKGLKLLKNKLTNEGLVRVMQVIPTVTNLNLSFNLLGDESLGVILANRQKVPTLRIINISNNKINERKVKSTVEQLKRQGIIVTI